MSGDAGFTDYEAQARAREALAKQIAPDNKKSLFDVLAAAAIRSVAIAFDGYGDEGSFEAPKAVDADGNDVDLPNVEIAFATVEWDGPRSVTSARRVRDVIEAMTYDLLAQTHAGWQDGEGAYGDFTFDVPTRAIVLQHNARFIESEHFDHVF